MSFQHSSNAHAAFSHLNPNVVGPLTGVPRGSILIPWPILFSLYMKSLCFELVDPLFGPNFNVFQ